MRLRTFVAALTMIAFLLPAGPARAAEIETLVTFDVDAGELPEGVAVDKRCTIYVSLIAPVSEIRAITSTSIEGADAARTSPTA